MKTLTFLGGSGFIGKSLIDFFNRGLMKKYKIKKINIICRKPDKLKRTKHLAFKNIKIIRGNIENLKKIPKSDIIIFGAESTNPKNYKNKKKIAKKHKKAINNFCKILKNFQKCKVLYLSSGAASSSQKNILSKSNYKKIYSDLKLYSENKIKRLSYLKIKTSIARCFTFAGPWLPKNSHYAFSNFLNDAKNKKFIYVNSNVTTVRSYMYSDDLVNWLLKIALNSRISCPIYNVGSDQKISINKLAIMIGKKLKKPVKFSKKNSKKIDKYVPNISKAKKQLNLKVNYNLMDTINLTIKHKNYEKIN